MTVRLWRLDHSRPLRCHSEEDIIDQSSHEDHKSVDQCQKAKNGEKGLKYSLTAPSDLREESGSSGTALWRDRVEYEGQGMFSSGFTTQDIVGEDRCGKVRNPESLACPSSPPVVVFSAGSSSHFAHVPLATQSLVPLSTRPPG